MRGAIPPFPHYVFMAWCLVKHRDNFTFYLFYHSATRRHNPEDLNLNLDSRIKMSIRKAMTPKCLWYIFVSVSSPRIQWLPEAKRLSREADHLLPPST
jgi:hypothetical protein